MKNKILNLSLIAVMLFCFSAFVFAEDAHGKAVKSSVPSISIQIKSPPFIATADDAVWNDFTGERFDNLNQNPTQESLINYKTGRADERLSEAVRYSRRVQRE